MCLLIGYRNTSSVGGISKSKLFETLAISFLYYEKHPREIHSSNVSKTNAELRSITDSIKNSHTLRR